MLITLAVFGFFYCGLIVHPHLVQDRETVLLLIWLYLMLFAGLFAVLLFAVVQFAGRWKDRPKSVIQPLAGGLALALLFGSGYLFGDGTVLNISGYEGDENTCHWLKLADMWIYAVYLLLGITFAAVFAGVIWSYLKKNR
jgi:hypothetical protein